MKIKIYFTVICFSLFLAAVSVSGAEKAIEIPPSWSNELKITAGSVVRTGLATNDGVLMTRAMIKSRFEEHSIVKAQRIVAKALENNLPVAPIVNKAYEGIAKQASAESIVKAMEKVRSRYEHAYGIASQLSSRKEVVDKLGYNLAAALVAGMTREDAEQLVSRLQVRMRTMQQAQGLDLVAECLLTARDMVRQGVSSGTATEVVTQGIEKAFSAQQIRSMRNAFMSHGAYGARETLAKSYADAIRDGRDPQGRQGPTRNPCHPLRAWQTGKHCQPWKRWQRCQRWQRWQQWQRWKRWQRWQRWKRWAWALMAHP